MLCQNLSSSWESKEGSNDPNDEIAPVPSVKLDSVLNVIGSLLYIDYKSMLALAENPMLHDRSKHIDIRSHFIRDCISNW